MQVPSQQVSPQQVTDVPAEPTQQVLLQQRSPKPQQVLPHFVSGSSHFKAEAKFPKTKMPRTRIKIKFFIVNFEKKFRTIETSDICYYA
jgi:hypothetical protein